MFKKLKTFFYRKLFQFRLNRGDLIKVDDRHRGVGKTTMMIKLAMDNGHGIVVGNQLAHDQIKSMCHYVKVFRLAPNYTIEMRGLAGSVLIDESLSLEMVEFLQAEPQWEIRGGFIANYGGEQNA